MLWVLQWFLGIYFIFVGIVHFIVPEGLPTLMEWMYDLDDTRHIIAGTAEILAGLGLILPAVTGIRPEIVVYAALGMVLLQVGAIFFHAPRGETMSIITNVFFIALFGYIAYGRAKLAPLPAKT